MSTNHTQGPHKVEQIGRRPTMKAVSATVLSPSGERLADFRHVADANLFAVSGVMLEALRQMTALAETSPSAGVHATPGQADVAWAQIERARALLAAVSGSKDNG